MSRPQEGRLRELGEEAGSVGRRDPERKGRSVG